MKRIITRLYFMCALIYFTHQAAGQTLTINSNYKIDISNTLNQRTGHVKDIYIITKNTYQSLQHLELENRVDTIQTRFEIFFIKKQFTKDGLLKFIRTKHTIDILRSQYEITDTTFFYSKHKLQLAKIKTTDTLGNISYASIHYKYSGNKIIETYQIDHLTKSEKDCYFNSYGQLISEVIAHFPFKDSIYYTYDKNGRVVIKSWYFLSTKEIAGKKEIVFLYSNDSSTIPQQVNTSSESTYICINAPLCSITSNNKINSCRFEVTYFFNESSYSKNHLQPAHQKDEDGSFEIVYNDKKLPIKIMGSYLFYKSQRVEQLILTKTTLAYHYQY